MSTTRGIAIPDRAGAGRWVLRLRGEDRWDAAFRSEVVDPRAAAAEGQSPTPTA